MTATPPLTSQSAEAQSGVDDTIRAYWQPGCTSCLRMKEFLTKRGVMFQSRNVLADAGARDELARFGLRQVPVVTRGNQWVDGQVLRDIARLAGIPFVAADKLTTDELLKRQLAVIDGARRYLGQIPEPALATVLPGRPRSLTQLGYHLFNVADAFIEHEEGVPLTFASYNREPKPGTMSKAELLAYGDHVRARVTNWWSGPGQTVDWSRKANVYYGQQSLHEFFERTTWHAGQHTRQLMWMMQTHLALEPQQPLGTETFSGLPMPDSIWDPA